MKVKRVMFAGCKSGSGKTTLTCGLLKCLLNKGFAVSAFKCGPDYIDPMFHSKVLGLSTGNLDSFFMDENTLTYLLCENAKGCDISVMEGVMGYYDGLSYTEKGSSYEVSMITKTPVILIVDCQGVGNSIGAEIKGFLAYRKNRIKGVIFNRMPPYLYEKAAEMAEGLGVRPLGFVPFMKEAVFESRRLGLITADEINDFKERIEKIVAIVKESVDIEGIISLAEAAEAIDYDPIHYELAPHEPVRIAVAKDAAFCFTYRDNIRFLERLGCEIIYFSPLEDEKLPESSGGLLLNGGYPELYAEKLSQNKKLLAHIKAQIEEGLPCIAECGGFMYLHEHLQGEDARYFEMVGVIKGNCFKTDKLVRFGYVNMEAIEDNLLGSQGERLCAHEFHYWESENPGNGFLMEKPGSKKKWEAVHAANHLYAGFPHIYFYGNPKAAIRFVNSAVAYGLKAGRKP